MSAATSANSVRRIFSLKDIIRTIPAHHPHVLGAGLLKRTLERQRIVQAIRAEEHRMSFCLVVQTDSNGSPGCGVLTAVPKPHAEETFAKCGPAPMLFGFLFDAIHHRGQLSSYLRPMGAKVPSIYGPSADDPGM